MDIIEEQLARFGQGGGLSVTEPVSASEPGPVRTQLSSRKNRKFSDFDFVEISEKQLTKIRELLGYILLEHCR